MSAEQAALIKQIQELKAAAERGELPGIMCLVERKDGTRQFIVAGDCADQSPAEIESARAVLEALANGEDPSGGVLKN
ncbi:MAG: hypothetical protein B7X88_22645 [Polaromonas sp. 17-63-33]|jgi:hypothetical protein|nr:MAG: hypothetical protein B7Y09_09375 [Polaromonas sp. 24-63-21]OZA47302.1 MAG: hypothetical protein B7X88_22645 [Polaromonas sp. 17-63-33]